jgi:hypothetical protein
MVRRKIEKKHGGEVKPVIETPKEMPVSAPAPKREPVVDKKALRAKLAADLFRSL